MELSSIVVYTSYTRQALCTGKWEDSRYLKIQEKLLRRIQNSGRYSGRYSGRLSGREDCNYIPHAGRNRHQSARHALWTGMGTSALRAVPWCRSAPPLTAAVVALSPAPLLLRSACARVFAELPTHRSGCLRVAIRRAAQRRARLLVYTPVCCTHALGAEVCTRATGAGGPLAS